MYEFEYRIREGILSFSLLKPVHPIHSDIADNISSKLITTPSMILVAVGLAAVFHPSLSPQPWAVALFFPALRWPLRSASFWSGRWRYRLSGPPGLGRSTRPILC